MYSFICFTNMGHEVKSDPQFSRPGMGDGDGRKFREDTVQLFIQTLGGVAGGSPYGKYQDREPSSP